MSNSGAPVLKGYIAKIVEGEVTATYEFQYNPTETERTRNVEFGWVSSQGSPMPEAVFCKIGKESFTIELMLDATVGYKADKEGVNSDIMALESFTWPDPELFSADLGQIAAPPQARFGIGDDNFVVVVETVRTRVTRRNKKGHPTRATVEVTMSSSFTNIQDTKNRLDRVTELAGRAFVQR